MTKWTHAGDHFTSQSEHLQIKIREITNSGSPCIITLLRYYSEQRAASPAWAPMHNRYHHHHYREIPVDTAWTPVKLCASPALLHHPSDIWYHEPWI